MTAAVSVEGKVGSTRTMNETPLLFIQPGHTFNTGWNKVKSYCSSPGREVEPRTRNAGSIEQQISHALLYYMRPNADPYIYSTE